MCGVQILRLVGAAGFEPATLCSQSRCATKLRYAPSNIGIIGDLGSNNNPKEAKEKISNIFLIFENKRKYRINRLLSAVIVTNLKHICSH